MAHQVTLHNTRHQFKIEDDESILQAALAAGLVGHVLAVVLNQRLEFGTACIQYTGKVERDVGRMVCIGAAKLVGPVVKKLPLVSTFFRKLDGVRVHISHTNEKKSEYPMRHMTRQRSRWLTGFQKIPVFPAL